MGIVIIISIWNEDDFLRNVIKDQRIKIIKKKLSVKCWAIGDYSICMPPRSDDGSEIPWSAFMAAVACSIPWQKEKYISCFLVSNHDENYNLINKWSGRSLTIRKYLKISKCHWHSTSSPQLEDVKSWISGTSRNVYQQLFNLQIWAKEILLHLLRRKQLTKPSTVGFFLWQWRRLPHLSSVQQFFPLFNHFSWMENQVQCQYFRGNLLRNNLLQFVLSAIWT